MNSLKPFWALFSYVKPVRNWFWFSVLLAIPMAAVRVGPVPLVKMLVDQLLVKKDTKSLLLLPLAVVGLFTANFIVRFFHYYSNRIVVVKTNQLIRETLMAHVLSLSTDYFTSERSGVLNSRVVMDPAQIDGGLGSLNAFLREPMTFIALLGYTTYVNWKLTLITFIMVPPLGLLFSWSGKHIKAQIKLYQEKFGVLMNSSQEAIQGIRVIHTYNLKDQVIRHFHEQMNNISIVLLKISQVEELTHPGVEWISSIAIAVILYAGGSAVLKGSMTSGELIAFFAAFAMMINPLRSLSDINSKIYAAAAAMERIQELLSWRGNVRDSAAPVEYKKLRNSVVFDDISFRYTGEETTVLKNVTFEIPRGKKIALVGPSGSGKSTCTQLLTRLADPTEGRILVDGIDLRELNLREWREHIALVSQDVFLFYDTVFENIRMGKPTASDEEVVHAAKLANSLQFIEKMPKGFQTIVGDRGMRLSGGERQRISIARAFLRNPDLLILDEATSNLDNTSEKLVQETLEHLMSEKTVLVIAHRLTTVRDVDQILVIEDGRIVERGHYDELSQAGGLFQQILASSMTRTTEATRV